jgi:RNA polymerase sigma-B factor
MTTPAPPLLAAPSGDRRRPGVAPARNHLIEAHLPLVRTLAARFARRGEPLDDLIQVGCVGLINAVDRYDPGRGDSFEAYATPTITGEIRRHLRDTSPGLRLPRRQWEEHGRIRRTRHELEARTGRSASHAEIAHATGAPLPAVVRALDPPRLEPLEHADGAPADPIGDVDERLALQAALRALPHRERRILLLSFYAEHSQRVIADDVGVSQIHVSRLLRTALERVRSLLEEARPVSTRVGEAVDSTQ